MTEYPVKWDIENAAYRVIILNNNGVVVTYYTDSKPNPSPDGRVIYLTTTNGTEVIIPTNVPYLIERQPQNKTLSPRDI